MARQEVDVKYIAVGCDKLIAEIGRISEKYGFLSADESNFSFSPILRYRRCADNVDDFHDFYLNLEQEVDVLTADLISIRMQEVGDKRIANWFFGVVVFSEEEPNLADRMQFTKVLGLIASKLNPIGLPWLFSDLVFAPSGQGHFVASAEISLMSVVQAPPSSFSALHDLASLSPEELASEVDKFSLEKNLHLLMGTEKPRSRVVEGVVSQILPPDLGR